MSLAFPLALAWAALSVPIVIFYILKIRLRRVPVSTTIFWQQIYDEKRPRSLWQILRHLLSLLIQITWLLLLVFALSEPYFKWEILQARRLVLVVDNSASMRASDVSPSRLEAAKGIGRQSISSLRMRDEMAIVAAGVQPQVVCGLTGHERTLQKALAGIEPSDGPTRVTDAVELAKRLLADAKHGRVVVLSDGCFEGSEQLAQDERIEWHSVGRRPANIGITNFQVRRSLLDPIGYEILTEVMNASDEPTECRLEIDFNDAPVDVIPLKLTPGQVWSKAIEKTSVEGGLLTARLAQVEDALATDNQAIALLPQRTERKITLVSEGNLFLRKVLEVNPLVRLNVTSILPSTYETDVLYVFHKQVPATMPQVSALVIDPTESTNLWQVGEKLENPIVTKQDSDSPLMRHVRLDNVLLPEARQLTPAKKAQALVTALSGDPLYFAMDESGGKVLVLTVNLDEGDLTFRTAFPIMVTNALAWFAGQSGELRESVATGAVADVALPTSAGPMEALSPSGKRFPLPLGVASAAVGPLNECGVWKVQNLLTETSLPGGSASKQNNESHVSKPIAELACNLASRAESDLRVPEKLLAAAPQTAAASGWFVRPIWFYLVAAAWLLATVEWFLYQRRWIS